jgi:hypothetical protein
VALGAGFPIINQTSWISHLAPFRTQILRVSKFIPHVLCRCTTTTPFLLCHVASGQRIYFHNSSRTHYDRHVVASSQRIYFHNSSRRTHYQMSIRGFDSLLLGIGYREGCLLLELNSSSMSSLRWINKFRNSLLLGIGYREG